MKFFVALSCVLLVSQSVLAADVTWSSANGRRSPAAGVANSPQFYQGANGVVLKFPAAGVFISENIPTTATADIAVVATFNQTNGAAVDPTAQNLGIGLIQTGGRAGSQSADCSLTAAVPLFGSTKGAPASTACISDFATSYRANPGSGASASGSETSLVSLIGTSAIKSVGIIVSPNTGTAATNCHEIEVYTNTTTRLPDAASYTFNPAGVCGSTPTQYFKAAATFSPTWAFYVENVLGDNTVCLQTIAQYTANPGNCISSGFIMTVMSLPLLLISVLFLN